MAVINLDEALNKARNRVNKIGIELEGGWTEKSAPAGRQNDSSVKFQRLPIPPEHQKGANDRFNFPNEYERYLKWYYKNHPAVTGELPSPAMELFTFKEGKRVENDFWKKWLKQHWPQYINETCGMHTHMSFNNALTYQRLMTPDYQDTYLEYLKRWALAKVAEGKIDAKHHIFERIEGKSEYCQRKFFADKQIVTTQKDYDHFRDGCRYTAVHYCWGRYQTIELRVIPMMPTVDLAIEIVEESLRITNAFCLASKRREPVHVIEGIIDIPEHREEIIACV